MTLLITSNGPSYLGLNSQWTTLLFTFFQIRGVNFIITWSLTWNSSALLQSLLCQQQVISLLVPAWHEQICMLWDNEFYPEEQLQFGIRVRFWSTRLCFCCVFSYSWMMVGYKNFVQEHSTPGTCIWKLDTIFRRRSSGFQCRTDPIID